MPIETMTVPVVSTGNLTPETRNMLQLEEISVPAFVGYYGWIIFVGEAVNDEDWPDDLKAAMRWARERNFEWIRFDVDAAYADGLVAYE